MNVVIHSTVAVQNAIASGYRRAADRLQQDRGAALAEYGLLLALVALAAVLILGIFGREIYQVFEQANETLETREGNIPGPANP